MYSRRTPPGFGKQGAGRTARKARLKPLKRPIQARAKFTVQAIYDAFVRIWRTNGWEAVTTRAVALETGVSVGTLYEYFPNKHALLSGYIRHCIDVLIEAIEREVIQAADLCWQDRLRRLVALTCGMGGSGMPHFDVEMLMLEHQVAEPKHHRRVYEELSELWIRAFAACTDAPRRAPPDRVRALFLSVWGGRRYMLLVQPTDITADSWKAEMEQLCVSVCMGTDKA